jgi:hypothetical protein
MKRRIVATPKAVIAAGALTLSICAVLIALTLMPNSTRARAVPERAIDMWGVEHDLTGRDWTLFDFVHPTGCGYCVLNAAAYQENFADALSSAGVSTFGVDVYDDQRDLIDYVKHHRIRFPILTEPDALWSRLHCPGLPGQSLFRNGQLVFSKCETLTFRNYDRVRDALADAGVGDRVPPYRPSGPMKKALNTVFEDERALVIVGDAFVPDAREFFAGLRKVVFHTKRAGEVTDADLSAGAVYVIGSPQENAFLERLRDKTPFRVRDDSIAFADTVLRGPDLMLSYCCPNPWNRERYLVVHTGTFGVSRVTFPYDGAQDFIVARRAGGDERPTAVIARGICAKRNNRWSLSACDVLWERDRLGERAETVPACGKEGCPKPSPAGVSHQPPVPAGSQDPGVPPAGLATNPYGLELGPRASWPGRFPALSAAGDGTCWAAWDRPQGGIYVNLAGEGDATPRRLWATGDGDPTEPRNGNLTLPGTTASIDAFKPVVVADGPRRCWLAWSEMESGTYQVFAARVPADGAAEIWRISNRSNLDHHSPTIVRAHDGTVTLVWYTWEANARRPYYRAWDGQSWSAVGRVPTRGDSQFAWYFSGTAERSDFARYVWMQHYPSLTSIVSAPLAGGDWKEPELIADTGRYPSIAFDPIHGQTRVVWQQWMPKQSNNLQYQWRIFTSVSRGDGQWTKPEQVPGCPTGRNATPVVAVDGDGRSWVFWSNKGGGDDRPEDGKWRIVCAVAGDDGWHGPYTVSNPSIDARSPSATSSGGSVWIAWHEGRGSEMSVVVRRIRPQAAGNEVAPEEWSRNAQTNN